MPVSKAAAVQVLPVVTACVADSAPVARRRLLAVSKIAKGEAMPVPVTEPFETAGR